MSKRTRNKFIFLILAVNMLVGIFIFANRPEPSNIGYESIIEKVEKQSEGVNSPSHNPKEDRTLVGL